MTWEDNNPSAQFVWELGDDVQSPTEADFKSAMIHELVHVLGFESGIRQDGGDTFDPPTPPVNQAYGMSSINSWPIPAAV